MLTRTKIRAYKQSSLARITPGQIKGLCKLGYGSPARKVREHCRKKVVTMPPFAASELGVEAGDFIVRCRTEVEDVLAIAKVSALDERDVDGQPILGEVVAVSKVRLDSGSIEITIPREAQAVFGVVTGKVDVLSTTRFPGMVTEKIVEPSRVSEELAKTPAEGLWRWPALIEDSTLAWLEGYEPFMEAMAETELPKRYPRRDPRNIDRVAAANKIMMDTADSQAELRRRDQWGKTKIRARRGHR